MKSKLMWQLLLAFVLLLSGIGCAHKAKQVPQGHLQSFAYGTSGMSNYEHRDFVVVRETSGVRLQINTWVDQGDETMKVEINRTVTEPYLLPSLEQLIREHNIAQWNGFVGHNSSALDGNSFGLRAVYDQGGTIQARGNVKMPTNYQKVRNAILALFQPYVEKYKDK